MDLVAVELALRVSAQALHRKGDLRCEHKAVGAEADSSINEIDAANQIDCVIISADEVRQTLGRVSSQMIDVIEAVS